MYLVCGHPCGLSGKLKFNLGHIIHNSLPCATSHVYCYTYDQPNGLPIEMLGIGKPSPNLLYKVPNCSVSITVRMYWVSLITESHGT